MRRFGFAFFAISLCFAVLPAADVLAQGSMTGQSKSRKSRSVELAPPQPSVVVKAEKGVRVWRPATGDSWPAVPPQTVRDGSDQHPSVTFLAPGAQGGYTGGGWYGGRGTKYGKRHRGDRYVNRRPFNSVGRPAGLGVVHAPRVTINITSQRGGGYGSIPSGRGIHGGQHGGGVHFGGHGSHGGRGVGGKGHGGKARMGGHGGFR